MRVKAFAKINLGLRVFAKRKDGYHNIDTIFVRVGIFDELEFRLHRGSKIILKTENAKIPLKENLVWRAAWLLQKFSAKPVGVDILLKKRIPIGAGLGGGSSDAATTLKSLNKLWQLKLKKTKLQSLAASLGSDVPFFLEEGIQRGCGRGEILKEINLPKNLPKNVLLVVPPIQISTKKAFAEIKNRKSEIGNRKFRNDFEKVVFRQFPELRKIKNQLTKNGAKLASLSGSGSAIFGLFKKRPDGEIIQKLEKFGSVFVAKIRG